MYEQHNKIHPQKQVKRMVRNDHMNPFIQSANQPGLCITESSKAMTIGFGGMPIQTGLFEFYTII